MIHLTLQELDDYFYIKAIGHSGEKHKSIVCAGVSALLETWRLSELALEQQQIDYTDEILEASVPKTSVSQILFINLCIGLTAIQKQYPSEISLKIGG